MKYWILKTEPETYSFQDLVKDKKATWDGVRNYQARNNIRSMEPGDMAVIYESVGPKAAVGLARVSSDPYPERKTNDEWSVVDLMPAGAFKEPVTLEMMKKDSILKDMILVRQSRLSVCPLTASQYKRLVTLGSAR